MLRSLLIFFYLIAVHVALVMNALHLGFSWMSGPTDGQKAPLLLLILSLNPFAWLQAGENAAFTFNTFLTLTIVWIMCLSIGLPFLYDAVTKSTKSKT